MKPVCRSTRASVLHLSMSLLIFVLAACGQSAPPLKAELTAPAQNAELKLGVSTQIAGRVTGGDVKAVDIYVDGIKYATVNTPIEPNTYDVVAPWTPQLPGTHVIQMKGVNEAGDALVTTDPLLVIVQGQAPTAPPPAPPPAPPTATPEPSPTPQPAPPPTAPPPTAAPAATPASATTGTPVPTATPPQASAPQLTITNDYANVRNGPGTGYNRLGQLDKGATAAVVGKSADGAWWQITYAGSPDGKAWVFGELVQFNGDAAKVPVVAAPPLPTAAPQTPAPTAAPPAAPTSDMPASALLPYSQNMSFSPRNDIGDVPLGYDGSKSSTLQWTVNGARKLELEITAAAGTGIFSNCPAGNMNSIQAAGFTPGQRVPLTVPSGQFPFSIADKGYYLFKIIVTKADGSVTDIPRNVIVDCYKTQ